MTQADITPKHALIMFWTNHWSYGRSPEVWLRYIQNQSAFETNASLEVIVKALDKMYYETLVNSEERINILSMLRSLDSENILLAISIMAARKPKKFGTVT